MGGIQAKKSLQKGWNARRRVHCTKIGQFYCIIALFRNPEGEGIAEIIEKGENCRVDDYSITTLVSLSEENKENSWISNIDNRMGYPSRLILFYFIYTFPLDYSKQKSSKSSFTDTIIASLPQILSYCLSSFICK